MGGTTEASQLAKALAEQGLDAIFSYAGRTESPAAQPIPTRVGGFGGEGGLRDYLRTERISHVIDASHPFAAQISRHAVQACGACGVPLLALERPPWRARHGDQWTHVPDLASAAQALPDAAARVFLAIGRQNLEGFLALRQHWYLLRLVDAAPHLPLAYGEIVLARGPFTEEGDRALMQAHGVTHVVAKNAGGRGAEAKLAAARALGLPVILVDRPTVPARDNVNTVEDAMRWIAGLPETRGHAAERGV